MSTIDIFLNLDHFYLSIWGFLVGMCIGSYLNVLVYREPLRIKKEWIIDSIETLEHFNIDLINKKNAKKIKSNPFKNEKRSYCPNCKKAIPFYLNIPIFGWLFLSGKSSCCGKNISPRYILIESFFACSYASFFYFFDPKSALILSFSLTILYVISSIDLKIEVIPDPLVYLFLWSGILYSSYFAPYESFNNLAYVSGTYVLIYLLNSIIKKIKGFDFIGMGDAKLLASSAAWLGIYGVSYVFIFSPFIFLIFSKSFKKRKMAFGPSISIVIMILMILEYGINFSLNPTIIVNGY